MRFLILDGMDVARVCVLVGIALVVSTFSYGATEVVINEVLFDPRGKDEGFEFVELYNPTSHPISLNRWQLQSGNGAREGAWKIEWEGGADDTIEARSFFVIGEELVEPTPDYITPLDLQNGPDAVRLISDSGEFDVVGWGRHTFEEYYEGEPVIQSSSGSSLGRDPDGVDSDNNSVDFRRFSIPTPGDYNHPPCDFKLEGVAISRFTSPADPSLDLVARIINIGSSQCSTGVFLKVICQGIASEAALERCFPPEQVFRFSLRIPNPGEGLHRLLGVVECEQDRWNENDSLWTSIVVFPPPIVINEIMFKPGSGDCEWIELVNRSNKTINLNGWEIGDPKSHLITNQDVILEPDGFLVIAEDTTVVRRRYGLKNDILLSPVGGWSKLNDTDGQYGYADYVILKDVFGTTVDSVAYRARWSEPFRSLERIEPSQPSTLASNWSPHYGNLPGSPGSCNSVSVYSVETKGFLTVVPQAFCPDEDLRKVACLKVTLPSPANVFVGIYDLRGRLVRKVLDGDYVESSRVTFWDGKQDDGRKAPLGVYIVLLQARCASGESLYSRSPVVLVRK